MTILDLLTNSLIEIGAVGAGEVPSAPDTQLAQSKLNALLDEWSARKLYTYAMVFSQFTLIANKGPHLIGAGAVITKTALAANVATYTANNNFKLGDLITVAGTTNGAGAFNVANQAVQSATATQFTLAIVHADVASANDSGTAYPAANTKPDFPVFQRPVHIEGCTIILNTSPTNVDLPTCHMRDADWWNYQRVKSLASNIPTDLYYEPDWPNGTLNFWPVPNFAYGVRLEIWTLLAQVQNLADIFTLPPGYQQAITMQLARNLCGPFKREWQAIQEAQRKEAIKAVQGNNAQSPRISTIDSGMPHSGSHSRSNFNYLTGGSGR